MNQRGWAPESWGLLYAAFAFSQGVGLLAYWALPLVTGALMTGMGLSTTQAGLVGSVEFAGLFLASICLANYVDRTSRRRMALVSLLIVIAANVLCGVTEPGFAGLLACRFVAGIGAGLALALGNATIANARDPEQFSGHLTAALVLFMVIIMPLLSRVSEAYGASGVFVGLAVIVAIAGGSIVFLPDKPDRSLMERESGSGSHGAVRLLGALALGILLIALLFGARGTLPWLVAEQLGTDAGYSLPALGNLFSLMYALSISGPVALIFLARKAGPRAILFWSLTVAGGFAWLFTVSKGNTLQFSVGIVVWAAVYFLAFAQLNAVAAMVDRHGRVASANGSAFIAGVTVAPIVGGYLVDKGGFAWLGAAIVLLTGIMALLVMFAIPRSIGADVAD